MTAPACSAQGRSLRRDRLPAASRCRTDIPEGRYAVLVAIVVVADLGDDDLTLSILQPPAGAFEQVVLGVGLGHDQFAGLFQRLVRNRDLERLTGLDLDFVVRRLRVARRRRFGKFMGTGMSLNRIKTARAAAVVFVSVAEFDRVTALQRGQREAGARQQVSVLASLRMRRSPLVGSTMMIMMITMTVTLA